MFNYTNINITFLYGQLTLHIYLYWSVNVNTSLKTGYMTAYNVIETIEFVSASFFISSIVILNGGPPQVKMGSWATRSTQFSQAHYIVWKEYIKSMDIYQKVIFSNNNNSLHEKNGLIKQINVTQYLLKDCFSKPIFSFIQLGLMFLTYY